MKIILSIALVFSFLFTFPSDIQAQKKKPRKKAVAGGSSATVSRRDLIRGPRGGCYYINRNGNKTYVDRSLCN